MGAATAAFVCLHKFVAQKMHFRCGARTGKIGDGKIFVVALAQAVRIRTGESGVEAV